MRLRLTALLLLFAAFPAAAEHFVPKNVQDGLGNRKVYQVCQDADGYIWFYTQGSIDRYDGFEFRHYYLEPEATEGAYLATSNTLIVSQEGVLHVVQSNGRVYRYDRESDALEAAFSTEHGHLLAVLFDAERTWLGTSEGLFSLEGDRRYGPAAEVNCLLKANGRLWIGTVSGLYVMDGETVRPVTAVPAVSVTALQGLEDGRIFIGTFSEGAYCFNSSANRCTPLPDPFPQVPVRKIVREGSRLLFGTDGAGIVDYDTVSESIVSMLRFSDQGDGLCADTVSDLLLDRNGILWVSTTTDGICFWDPGRLDPRWIRHLTGMGSNSLISNHVNAVLEDKKGCLWFATNKGLCRLEDGRWSSFNIPGGAEVVLILAEDEAGRIWAGGYGHPVFSVDNKDRVRVLDPGRFHYTFSLEVADGRLWIGDLNEPITALALDGSGEQTFPEREIWDLFSENGMWVASHTGLAQASLADSTLRWLPLPEGANGGWCITKDAQGRIWAGLESGGILCYNPRDSTFRRYPLEGTILSIEYGSDGKIWAVGDDNIYRLDPEEGSPVVMNRFLGLGNGEFNHTASTRLRDGSLVFGTANGALIFDPSRIPDGEMTPVTPVLTSFRLLTGDSQRILKGRSIESLDHIVLRSGERSFSLSYSALSLREQARLRFDYQLKGYDPEPHGSFSAGAADYKEVPPGHYVFTVKAVDMLTGKMMGERSLRVSVRPPVWMSRWAQVVYLLLIILALWLLDRSRRRKIRRQMTQERLDTFIRFAHELKTPVSLIRAPLSVLDKEGDLQPREKESVSTAIRNTDRLMGMINSLLDLREDGNFSSRLQLEPCDLADYLGETLDSFQPLARKKGIGLNISVAEGLGEVQIDREKMDRIVQNLVSNAVKYTETGAVNVWAEPAGKMWRLRVQDTGIGIPAAVRSRIFNGGVRAANARDVDETGYGIGLMITRQLVTLHRGTISLKSEEGAGSQFTLQFPMEYRESTGAVVKAALPEQSTEETSQDSSRARILIVEDDEEMLRFLKDYLKDDFETVTAPDGDAAVRMAEQLQPDLVLSDVIMPGMNGYELCRQLKSALPTSHIPVILLTAMDDKEHIIMGLEAGSDDYILKPFDPQVLSARISNLLHERERLRALVLRSGREQKQREYTNRLDKEFMEKVLSVVEASYSDPAFQIDDLCRSMAMSRTAFFNKLKALSGTGPNDFIRIYRLDRAKELLESGRFTIAEVADQVGFSDAKYFSSCFKRAFGVSPSKY